MSVVGPGEVNWSLLNRLAAKPHPHFDIVEGLEADAVGHPNYAGEVYQEARNVQHLCDLAGVPAGEGGSARIDARVYLLIAERNALLERLERIADWHSREAGPAGTVGDYCTEGGERWPCDTRRMAEGTYGQRAGDKHYDGCKDDGSVCECHDPKGAS